MAAAQLRREYGFIWKIEAQKMVEEVNKDEIDVRRKTEELKKQFNVYKAKMEALLISQLELLQEDKTEGE